MHEGPEVSVIMAVYNAARYVGRSVRSVLGQTFGDFELICVDDGSVDGSVEELKRLAAADPRIKVVEGPHVGACATLNRGLDLVRGRFIAFIDNDDVYHPRTLELAVRAMREVKFDVVIWDRFDVEDDGTQDAVFPPLPPFSVEVLSDYIGWGIGDHHVAFWCKLYRREIVADIRFEPTMTYGDVLFHWRLLSKRKLRIGHIPLQLHRYSVRPDSVMHSRIDEKKAVDKVRALEFIFEYAEETPGLRRRLQRGLFPECIWSAYKVTRRQPELRPVVFPAMRRVFAVGVVRWFDLPFGRHLKMRTALLFRK